VPYVSIVVLMLAWPRNFWMNSAAYPTLLRYRAMLCRKGGADVSGVRVRVRDVCGFPGLVHDVLYQAHAYYCAGSRGEWDRGRVPLLN